MRSKLALDLKIQEFRASGFFQKSEPSTRIRLKAILVDFQGYYMEIVARPRHSPNELDIWGSSLKLMDT